MTALEFFCCLTALATFTSGIYIECDYEMVTWGVGFGMLYTCGATGTRAENPTTVTEVSGTHVARKSDADVTGLWIQSLEMLAFTTIPNSIGKCFPNIEAIEWFNGKISSIDASTFNQFPNLLFINLGRNKLTMLDGDLFQHSRKLQWISFQNNLIEHVGHDLLTGLINLEHVWFNSNLCIDAQAKHQQNIQELNRRLPVECPPLPATIETTAEHNNSSGQRAHWRLLIYALPFLILILNIRA